MNLILVILPIWLSIFFSFNCICIVDIFKYHFNFGSNFYLQYWLRLTIIIFFFCLLGTRIMNFSRFRHSWRQGGGDGDWFFLWGRERGELSTDSPGPLPLLKTKACDFDNKHFCTIKTNQLLNLKEEKNYFFEALLNRL